MINYKSIVFNKKNEKWFGQDFTMNIYRGCSHGCIYCDSISDCYGIKDFNKVVAKEDAIKIIYNDLKKKREKGIVATGAMSDPYNPLEKKLQLTRKSLELINKFGFGVFITTKSDLITRDIDLLLEIKKHSPVIIGLTITAFDDELSKKIEQFAPVSSKRFDALKTLSDNNIFSGIMLMPVLPFIEDTEINIKNIVLEGDKVGVNFISPYFGVTLRDNQREYFYHKLDEKFTGLKEKYIELFKNEYNCTSPNSKKLWGIFSRLCKEHNILYDMKDIIKAYKSGYTFEQLKFF